jgi:TPP-dependent pyruvate/acetoin dehydrogenase alpha subunit
LDRHQSHGHISRMALDGEELLEIYRIMVLARRFQEAAIALSESGKFDNYHAGIGQEAVGIGACFTLRPTDFVLPHYRGVGSLLVRGFTPREIMAGLYGTGDSPTLGRTPIFHVGDMTRGVLSTSSMVGSIIPFGAGSALASKLGHTDEVTVAIFGEGAANRGDFHEGLNLAAIWKLPVIFVCENNFYAKSSPIEKTTAGGTVWRRAASYGIPGEVVDGNEVEAVVSAMDRAISRARDQLGPSLIECQTYRWCAHSTLAPEEATRPEEEVARWKNRCPIARLADRLVALGLADASILRAIDEAAHDTIVDCIEFAERSPLAAPDAGLAHVYV